MFYDNYFNRYRISRAEAIERGMTIHAGPYHLQHESWMLQRCLDDFKLKPERRFALVNSREKDRVNIWADRAEENPDSQRIRLYRESKRS